MKPRWTEAVRTAGSAPSIATITSPGRGSRRAMLSKHASSIGLPRCAGTNRLYSAASGIDGFRAREARQRKRGG